MNPHPITEHVARSDRHTCFYLACGDEQAPLVIFCHGWPELSVSWRHQLHALAALGFRAIAPDMRGYGRSSVYPRHEDYAVEHSVVDMLGLLDALGRERAVWVGHDWGTPVVWGLASHHPDRCFGVAGLCVPYMPQGFAPATVIPLVDRDLYPEDKYPAGQWDYMLFYEERFHDACELFDRDPVKTMRAMMRGANPQRLGKPAPLSVIRRDGGWFGGKGVVPDLPLDTRVLDQPWLMEYAAGLARNGFFGPDSWYMNGERNMAFAARSLNAGRLDMPVLFLHAAYDLTCQTIGSRLADPMREHCSNLTEFTVPSAHWMAQEKPVEVNAGLAKWLATQFAGLWVV